VERSYENKGAFFYAKKIPMKLEKILLREWFVFFTVFLLAAFLGGISFAVYRKPFLADQLAAVNENRMIFVAVSGFVEYPGVYEVPVGTTLGAVMKEARLKKEASQKGLYLKKILLNSCSVHVSEKKVLKRGRKKVERASLPEGEDSIDFMR
jgi:hypothetical protein